MRNSQIYLFVRSKAGFLSFLSGLVVLLFISLFIMPTTISEAALEGVDSGLVGWWKFNEGSGANATDSSGSGNNGTLVSNPVWTAGKIGGALSFSGSNYVRIPSADSLNFATTSSFSYSLWVKPVSAPSHSSPLWKGGEQAGSKGYSVSAKYWVAGISDGTTAKQAKFGSATIFNSWSLLTTVVNREDKTLKTYLNGVYTNNSADISSLGSVANNTALQIGMGSNWLPYNGLIDDVRIYNRALSASEILDLYHLGLVTYTFILARDGAGSGLVSGGSINCGSACSAMLEESTSLTLNAIPDAESLFAGWSGGGCTGTGSCAITLNADTQVTATFNTLPQDNEPPSTPANLTATPVSSTKINLSWNPSIDNIGVSGYRLYRNGLELTSTSSAAYSDVGLSPSTVYNYTVYAYDARGNASPQSAAVSARTEESGIVAAASCSAAHVNMAISQATPGDTVIIPPCPQGTDVWGSNTATVNINKKITLKGSGNESTIITLGSGTGLNIIADGAVARDFKIVTNSATATNAVFFATGGVEWRVTGMIFDQGSNYIGYVFNIGKPKVGETRTYGLIDSNQFLNLKNEQVNWRGPCDSWDTDHSFGKANNLFIENNILSATPGSSFYWDSNANSRLVARYNTLTRGYFDQHGMESNSDLCSPEKHASARSIEMYNNKFVNPIWMSVYIRGGTGLVYNNIVETNSHTGGTAGGVWMDIYTVRTNPGTWGGTKFYYPATGYFCKTDYPTIYQIGRGKNQGSEPIYIWNNTYKDNGASISIGYGYSGGTASAAGRTLCNDPTYNVRDLVVEGGDFCLHNTSTSCNGYNLSLYTPYACPHPLTGLTGTCDSNIAGREGYNVGNVSPAIPPAPTCASFTYSNWSTCVGGTQIRTVLTSSPLGCTGGSPLLSQVCSMPPNSPLNGLCSTTLNTCLQGNLTDTPDSSLNYLWSCTGVNGGSLANCSKAKLSNQASSPNPSLAIDNQAKAGVCSASLNTCEVGTFSDSPDSATIYKWTCLGINKGVNTSCALYKSLVKANPSLSNGKLASSTPPLNLPLSKRENNVPLLIKEGAGGGVVSYPITNDKLYNRLKGRIVLKAESKGEAYYISPTSKIMYYLSRPTDAFTIMRKLALGISNSDINKIPLGFINPPNPPFQGGIIPGGQADTDQDGLNDMLEESIGTSINNKDSDNDSYSDYDELLTNYSPLVKNRKLELDNNLAKKLKGKIILQVESKGEAWYINPVDLKRYYMARPIDAFTLMRVMGVGVSNRDYILMVWKLNRKK